MDIAKTENQLQTVSDYANLPAPLRGMARLPLVRQAGLLLGLAASIALGGAVMLWSQRPVYTVLYSNATGMDSMQMARTLDQAGIAYRLDPDSGTLQVESGKVYQAKLKLAAENLVNPQGQGFELINKDQGFGASAFIQTARYQRAREVELARTIMSISSVQSARVHLALPKESAFVRKRRQPSASVMVKLNSGRKLQSGQITAITNLVSASIPNMQSSDVTLVDDKGNLLSSSEKDEALMLSNTQFEYTKKVEQAYIARVENILSPLVGLNGVRAQVNADIDFTRSESTSEVYNPDLPALRSEQRMEEKSVGNVLEGGIPGALSNSPPAAATAPEQVGAATQTAATIQPSRSRSRATRNYELDKTISHQKRVPGTIRKLSVAVVLNIKQAIDEKGNATPQPYTPEELARYTTLVKQAIGFSVLRGDSVNVVNAAFLLPEVLVLEDEPLWDKPWFWSVVKQILGVVAVLLLLFGVLRPAMRSLSRVPNVVASGAEGDALGEDQLTLSDGSGGGGRLPKPTTYVDNLNMAKELAGQEPKRVAQVVRGWLEDAK